MKKSGTYFLINKGIPEIITLGTGLFIVFAFVNGWIHGIISTIFSLITFILCALSTCGREYQEVKNRMI